MQPIVSVSDTCSLGEEGVTGVPGCLGEAGCPVCRATGCGPVGRVSGLEEEAVDSGSSRIT